MRQVMTAGRMGGIWNGEMNQLGNCSMLNSMRDFPAFRHVA
jgi:hypothetical protein